MNVLVTGGAGYIGSHTVIGLIEEGHEVIVIDNLSNSKIEVINRIETITGVRPMFYEADLLDRKILEEIFDEHPIEMVIHFAGFKAVGESVEKPLMYYHNNITGTLTLLEVMQKSNVKKIVFSSSATVYDPGNNSPLSEEMNLGTTNPYGSTKLMIEGILRDLHQSDSEWQIALLRYFNPIGAHNSGLIGEDPRGIPNNLMPYITQVAVGKREHLSVFGDDYDTHDGTGVRDYIHVVDLANGHLKAMEKINNEAGIFTYNLGTGIGYSVLDVVKNFEMATGLKIPYQIVKRRPGDIGVCYSNPGKAKKEIDWAAKYNLEDMCRDSWRWQQMNPAGY